MSDHLDEARELVNRLLDDELTPADAARLERLVCEDADVRELYIFHVHLWCNLAPLFTSSPATDLTTGEVLESEASMVLPALSPADASDDDEPAPIELPPLVWPAVSKPSPWPRRLYPLGALAATLLLAAAALLWPRGERPLANRSPRAGEVPSFDTGGVWAVPPASQPGVGAPAPEVSAVLARAVGAEWAPPHHGLRPGQRVHDGMLVLRQGLAELQFANGVSMIVEAPARLRIASDMRTDLHGGKLVASVPQAAVGFAVETTSAAVVDLGTEFGVEVDPADVTRVEVFQGKVRTNPPAAPLSLATTAPATASAGFASRELVAGEAGRVEPGASAVAVGPSEPLSFVRGEEFGVRGAAAAGSRYHRWLASTYALRRDPALAAYYAFQGPAGGGSGAAVVVNRATYAAASVGARPQRFDLTLGAPGGDGRPAWAPGRWPEKAALDFQPASRHVASLEEFPYPTNGRLTVAAWVFARSHAYWGAIVKNRGDTKQTQGQFSLGLYGSEGTLVGRVQQDDGVEVLVREPVASPVPLGRWVHVAMVADGATLRVYRDGAEVGSAPCTGPTKAPEPKSLAVGFRAGPNGGPTTVNRGEFWDGLIDELAIFHRAVSPGDVRALYEAGRP